MFPAGSEARLRPVPFVSLKSPWFVCDFSFMIKNVPSGYPLTRKYGRALVRKCSDWPKFMSFLWKLDTTLGSMTRKVQSWPMLHGYTSGRPSLLASNNSWVLCGTWHSHAFCCLIFQYFTFQSFLFRQNLHSQDLGPFSLTSELIPILLCHFHFVNNIFVFVNKM